MDATVGVRENITQLFDERRVSIEALQPSSAEVGRAISSALRALALRFTAGALLVVLLVLGVLGYGRRRRPTGPHLVAAGLAVVTAVVATGAGAWQSYQPSKLESFTTTGLLGTLRRNAGLLSDVETRAQQATPYVRNLLALSQALQEKFVPGEINQPTAARILLVSDVHGANQYPVMKRIIADEQIDAVIDSGDLLNFGSVAEAEAAGLFTSIAGLGVPYLFVRGNHDAGSPDGPGAAAADGPAAQRRPARARRRQLHAGHRQRRDRRRLQRPPLVRRRQPQQRGQADARGRGLQPRVRRPRGARRRGLPRAGRRPRRSTPRASSSTATCTPTSSRATGSASAPSPAAARSATSCRTRRRRPARATWASSPGSPTRSTSRCSARAAR